MMRDNETYDRGDAAMLAAQILLAADLTEEERSVALGKVLRLNDELLRRGWFFVDEYQLDDPHLAVFFSFHVDSTDGYNSHSIYWNCYPVEGTISIRREVDELDFVDLAPQAWFTVDDTEGLAMVFDAVPKLTYKDPLPTACYENGVIVEWGDELYEATLTADQVQARRGGPQSLPADQVLDALREVYDTCPDCGTVTEDPAHHCKGAS